VGIAIHLPARSSSIVGLEVFDAIVYVLKELHRFKKCLRFGVCVGNE
jgi:hypothetical protein